MWRIKFIVVFVILLFTLTVFSFLYLQNDKRVAVLGYHGILPSDINKGHPELVIDSELFESQLKTLKNMGYKSMSLDEYYCWHEKKCKKNHRSVLITFDDGYINNYKYAFPLLKKYDMKAVVFIVGKYSEIENNIYISKSDIEKVRIEYPNIEFASHSYNHHGKIANTYNEVIEDTKNMKKVIDTKYLAYPHGHYTDDYIRALKDSNYKMAFTFGPKKSHRKSSIDDDSYKIPRLNISNGMSSNKFKLRMILPM